MRALCDGGAGIGDRDRAVAGPCGLVVGITLARSGVDVLVVEQRDGGSSLSRALVISTRGMELMRRFGLEKRIRAGAAGLPASAASPPTQRAGASISDRRYAAAPCRWKTPCAGGSCSTRSRASASTPEPGRQPAWRSPRGDPRPQCRDRVQPPDANPAVATPHTVSRRACPSRLHRRSRSRAHRRCGCAARLSGRDAGAGRTQSLNHFLSAA
jgi:hypothetical protein